MSWAEPGYLKIVGGRGSPADGKRPRSPRGRGAGAFRHVWKPMICVDGRLILSGTTPGIANVHGFGLDPLGGMHGLGNPLGE